MPGSSSTCPAGRRHLVRASGCTCSRLARWLEFEEWPPPATSRRGYYLRHGGALAIDAEPGDAPPASFTYDPADPTPTAGGPVLQPPGKQVDNAAIEARPDVLTYTSERLAADQDIIGPVSARVYVRTSLEYADVFVRLCDVDDKGVSRNVVDGIRRLNPQTAPPAGPDGVLTIDIELFPTAYRMRPATRCGYRSAAAHSPGTPATTGRASLSAPRSLRSAAISRSSPTPSTRDMSSCPLTPPVDSLLLTGRP